jgi:hypothetical protein
LEVCKTVEVQQCLDGIWARVHRLVWLWDALDPADRVALEVVRAELFSDHRHVVGEVVVHVESRVVGMGVEDSDLAGRHCDWGAKSLRKRLSTGCKSFPVVAKVRIYGEESGVVRGQLVLRAENDCGEHAQVCSLQFEAFIRDIPGCCWKS